MVELDMLYKIERCRDYDTLAEVWFASVKATHDFLSDEDLNYYHERVPVLYMPNVDIYAIRDAEGAWRSFIGLSGDMIEMLFVHPDSLGRGYGTALLRFAVKEMSVRKVDVNEQNLRALRFYRKHGFEIFGRDDVDSEGKMYPILHLIYKDKTL